MVDDTTRKSGSSEGLEHRAPAPRNKTVHTALISGTHFHAKAVQYVVLDGLAMFEGDIILGTVEQVEAETQARRAELTGGVAAGVLISGTQFRWPNCVVPYTIDPALPDQARVNDAIAHWSANTRFSFVLRTAANAASHPDWVTFQPGGGCSAHVGRRGGQQFVTLAAGCTLGNTIHEIGHAVGLWHEQSREDRDAFVTIRWERIQTGTEHNFNQHISDGDDVGAYDYGSIMHYPRTAFSRDGQDTIIPTDPAAVIGQRNGLSPGDIAAANSMCPAASTIETLKEFTKELVGETVKERIETTRETLKERIETAKELAPETVKERIPETLKERVPETRKELVETLVEGVQTLVEGVGGTAVEGVGGTAVEGIGLPGGTGQVINPADLGLPFAMATPHAGHPGAVPDPCGCTGEAVEPVLDLESRLAALEEVVGLLAAAHDAAAGLGPA